MKLIVHELETSLSQSLTPDRNIVLEAVRPHIYRHNFADGALKLQVLNAEDEVIAESDNVDISDLGESNFFHGYVRFLVNAGLKKGQSYSFKLVGVDGYSFDESAYIGWCNGYDLGKYPVDSEENEPSLMAPLDLEIWERKLR